MPVDLQHALNVVGSHAILSTQSSSQLVERVEASPYFDPSGGKRLIEVPDLNGGIRVQAVEALHLLAQATGPRYRDEIFDLYSHWGLLRYLGFFDLLVDDPDKFPILNISEGGRGIVGNQRRVTSEDLGIGFGVLLGSRWLQHSVGSEVPVGVVDIDVALNNRFMFAGGAKMAVKTTGTLRPDYLLIAQHPTAANRYFIRSLECKGTRSAAHAISQLAKAAKQLAGIEVNGRIPIGLAVATIASNSGISCLLLDPDDEDSGVASEDLAFEVNQESLERALTVNLDDRITTVQGPELISAALRASWAGLADFAGNSGAARRWAPIAMRRLLPDRGRQRQIQDTPFGAALGYTLTIEAGGIRVRVSYLIGANIDTRLTAGSAYDIALAQRQFSEEIEGGSSSSDFPIPVVQYQQSRTARYSQFRSINPQLEQQHSIGSAKRRGIVASQISHVTNSRPSEMLLVSVFVLRTASCRPRGDVAPTC